MNGGEQDHAVHFKDLFKKNESFMNETKLDASEYLETMATVGDWGQCQLPLTTRVVHTLWSPATTEMVPGSQRVRSLTVREWAPPSSTWISLKRL